MEGGLISFAEPEPVRPTSHRAQCLLHLLERAPLKDTLPPLSSPLALCPLGGRNHPTCCALSLCKESWGSSCLTAFPSLLPQPCRNGRCHLLGSPELSCWPR